MIESDLLSIRTCKGYTDNWARKIFTTDSVLKTNPWTYKLKIQREKKIGSFFEKELFLSKLKMSYYPEPNSYIRDKVKVVLDL